MQAVVVDVLGELQANQTKQPDLVVQAVAVTAVLLYQEQQIQELAEQ
jgi:hypothetical protein